MNSTNPAIGNVVVLKDGSSGRGRNRTPCRIVAILPSDGGEKQYRVRFEAENFERRIVLSDIDTLATESVLPQKPAGNTQDEPWLKPSAVRTSR
ncbi:cold-shock protein [Rhizobium daejeonense]|uniref:cold-shock protein n=1 Tax=Rhizobium daejeonense TaxID=240521 RepID=UPI001FCED6CC|nr:cold-shock protein [Rhizobium daejeonense]